MCMVSFCFADKMRIIWIVISLAPMMGASMTRRDAHGDGDDIIGNGRTAAWTSLAEKRGGSPESFLQYGPTAMCWLAPRGDGTNNAH